MPDPTSFTPAGYLWVFLTVLSTSCIWVGFYVPHWIVGAISLNGRKNVVYLGPFRRCNYPIFNEVLQQFQMHSGCGIYVSFHDIPSIFWQICVVSVGLGGFVSLIVVMVLVPSCCFGIMRRELASWIRVFQIASAFGVAFGCAIFPFGWTNSEVKDACGPRVGYYALGDCRLGWSIFVLFAGLGLLLVSVLFSSCAVRSAASTNRRPSTTSVARSAASRRRAFPRDENSFDAEALINKNLRLPAAQPPWEHYVGDQSPFIPRHSEMV